MSSKPLKLSKLLKNPERDQFQYTVHFQLELLRFLIQSRESILHIQDIKSSYFTLLEHCLICEAIQRSFKRYRKIPGEVVLTEFIREMLNSKEFVALTTKEDINVLNVLVHNLYTIPIKDEDIIKTSLLKFIAYVQIKSLNEETDFTNYDNLQIYNQKVSKILRDSQGLKSKDEPIYYMVEGTSQRQLQRLVDPDIIPSPYRQLNELTNAGGYEKYSIMVLLDKAKAKKTFTLINIARGYLAMKKNVLYIDTENGSKQIMGRMIQSTLKKTKTEILGGEYDKMEKKHMRKYKRLGVEFIVKKVPALVADASTIKGIIQQVQTEKNIKIHIVIIDYAGKMASLTRDKDDFERIGNVYVDLQNLAYDEDIDAIWTAHHVTREGAKHQETRYEESDISGSISIIRNAQCVIGLNSTEEERENDIQRMEIVVQRDGRPNGRALFNIDVDRQYMREFTKEGRKAYDETQGQLVDKMLSKKKNKQVGPNANQEKSGHKSGDI